MEVIGPRAVIPSTVTYPGMPASRLWEFEDARVDFGGVEANPEDLGRMLLTEFALVYGGDWLLVPLEAPAGSLVRIVALDVRDTFGRVVRVGPTTSTRAAECGLAHVRDLARRRVRRRGAGINAPQDVLFVAPALASSLQGRAIEEVLLLRDEMANMAWAVERSVEGAHGLPMDRAAAEYARRPDPAPPSAACRHAHVSASYRRPAALVAAAAAAAGAERSVDDAAPGSAAVDSARRQRSFPYGRWASCLQRRRKNPSSCAKRKCRGKARA